MEKNLETFLNDKDGGKGLVCKMPKNRSNNILNITNSQILRVKELTTFRNDRNDDYLFEDISNSVRIFVKLVLDENNFNLDFKLFNIFTLIESYYGNTRPHKDQEIFEQISNILN